MPIGMCTQTQQDGGLFSPLSFILLRGLKIVFIKAALLMLKSKSSASKRFSTLRDQT